MLKISKVHNRIIICKFHRTYRVLVFSLPFPGVFPEKKNQSQDSSQYTKQDSKHIMKNFSKRFRLIALKIISDSNIIEDIFAVTASLHLIVEGAAGSKLQILKK